ncbi:BFO_1060 family glycosyltransferase [Vibrio sp. DNB22_19_2]
MSKIMFLEWSTELTRDRLASVPIINYLKLSNVLIVQAPLQNAFWNIDIERPDIIVLMNTNGAFTSIDVARYAKKKGCIVISLFGEGNFQEERIEQFLFGHNKKDKELIDDYRLVWSLRAKELVDKHYPDRSKTTYFCGGPGADNYVLTRGSHNVIFDKYNLNKNDYKLVLGVGCWDFGLLSDKDHRHEFIEKNISKLEQRRIMDDGHKFNKTLTQLAENFDDVLFLIKEHPHKSKVVNDPSMISGINKLGNALVVDHDESITDCIQASDIWLSYESTTAMEAWIAGVSTGLLNPSGIDFESNWRASVCKGQPNFRNFEEWRDAIEYYTTHKILPSENDYEDIRRSILEDVFGHVDGLNHVRIGNFIIDKCKETEKLKVKNNFSLKSIVKMLIWNFSKLLNFLKLNRVLFLLPSSFNVRKWDVLYGKKYEDTIMIKQKKLYLVNGLTISKIRDFQ